MLNCIGDWGDAVLGPAGIPVYMGLYLVFD